MPGGGGIPDVRLQHRIVLQTRQRDAVVRQDVDVVLGVLAELGYRGVLEDRLQRFEDGIAIKLLWRAGIVVCQRDIAGLARLHCEAEADDVGQHRVDAGGFGVEGDQFRAAQLVQPGIESGLGGDQLVLARRLQESTLLCAIFVRGVFNRPLCAHRVRSYDRFSPVEIFQRGLEFIARVELAQGFGVRLAPGQVLRPEFEFHVSLDGDQLTRQRQLRQRGAQVFPDLSTHLIRVFHYPIKGVIGGQPLGRSLGAALGHAGYVVDAVAGKRQEVDDLLRSHAELGEYAIAAHHRVTHGVDQGDLVADQLRHVLVAGRDQHFDAFRLRLHGEGADHVVRLDPGNAQDREPQRADDGQHGLHLRAQVVRHRRPIGLVLVVKFVAERLAGRIADKREIGRCLLQGCSEHVDDAEQCAGGFTVRVGQWRQRVECPVKIGGTVDENELGHAGILSRAIMRRRFTAARQRR